MNWGQPASEWPSHTSPNQSEKTRLWFEKQRREGTGQERLYEMGPMLGSALCGLRPWCGCA